MKLRYQFLAIFGLVAAVPLLLFWVWPHSHTMTDEVEDVRDRHMLIAETIAISLKHYHRDVTVAFGLIYANLGKHGSVEGAEDLLQELHFGNICVFDPESRLIRQRLDSFDNRCQENLSEAEFAFYRSLTPNGDVGLSPVLAGPDGSPTLYAAAQKGGMLIVGALYTDFFVETARSISLGRQGHAVIVDQSGQVLGHPNDEWMRERRSLAAVAPVERMLQGESGVMAFSAPFLGAEAVAAYKMVGEAGWGVMVVQPLAELHEEVHTIARSALVVVTIGLLAAVAIGSVVAFYMAGPLRAVSQAARRMAAGDTEARTPVSEGYFVPEEVRDLQTSFNVMAEAMERSRRYEQEARLKAEGASRSKSAFLANMSHELRTPLNAILGFSEVMIAETFGKIGTPRYAEYLKDIKVSASHLLDLINDLLDLSRIEAGAMKLQEVWVGLDDSLEECAGMFRAGAAGKGLSLEVDNRAGSLAVLVDERALRQILINLLSNAVRHTPRGGKVVLGAAPAGDGGLDVFVADSGVGIPAKDLQRVLQPFEQARSGQRGSGEGTGLGLAIVKELVDLHGGELSLDSTVGQGTTVTFRLPPARLRARGKETARQRAGS